MKALSIEVKDSIVALRFEANELVTTMKVIMMAMGKTLIVGCASEYKGKDKVPKPKPNMRDKNAQKDEECVNNMVASYIKEVAFIAM